MRREENKINEVLDRCVDHGPSRAQSANEYPYRYDQPVRFYPEVASVLHRLRFSGVKIAACSRTCTPKLYALHRQVLPRDSSLSYGRRAREALNLLLVPPSKAEPSEAPKRAIEYFDKLEMYPGMQRFLLNSPAQSFKIPLLSGSKITHFRELHKKTNIPYDQMVRYFLTFCLQMAELSYISKQLFFDDERRNKEVEKLGALPHEIEPRFSAD